MKPTSFPIRVRPMKSPDLAPIREISTQAPQAPQWPHSAYLAAFDRARTPRRIALVAEDGVTRRLVGYAVASLVEDEAELETIAVATEFQRLGVARRLFGTIARALRLARVVLIKLEVRDSNQAALAFYRSLGFTQSGLRPRYYSDPVEDAVLMNLPLTQNSSFLSAPSPAPGPG